MELISQPEIIEERVRDLDIMFAGGVRDSLTLRDSDTLNWEDRYIIIYIVSPAESIIYNRDQILGTRLRERIIHRPIKKDKA